MRRNPQGSADPRFLLLLTSKRGAVRIVGDEVGEPFISRRVAAHFVARAEAKHRGYIASIVEIEPGASAPPSPG